MKLGSQAVQDVVRTASVFVLSCQEHPFDPANDEQERLFLELHGALHFLQELVDRGEQ